VGVEIDEAGRHVETVGLDDGPGRIIGVTHGDDPSPVDGHVGLTGGAAGAVDHRAAADQ
jgi:hypothetical protein